QPAMGFDHALADRQTNASAIDPRPTAMLETIKRLEHSRAFSWGNPRPTIADGEEQARTIEPNRDCDGGARVGKFQAILDDIPEDLLNLDIVQRDKRNAVGHLQLQRAPRQLGREPVEHPIDDLD